MRFIPTKIHGILDYVMGAVLIVAPFILGFNTGAAMLVPVILGASMLLMSLMTDYELGAIKKIPMSMHLTIDFLSGALLAVSPWLFGFADYVWAPHLILGVAEILASLTTEKTPRHAHQHTHGHA